MSTVEAARRWLGRIVRRWSEVRDIRFRPALSAALLLCLGLLPLHRFPLPLRIRVFIFCHESSVGYNRNWRTDKIRQMRNARTLAVTACFGFPMCFR
jgi:hypothetical protein